MAHHQFISYYLRNIHTFLFVFLRIFINPGGSEKIYFVHVTMDRRLEENFKRVDYMILLSAKFHDRLNKKFVKIGENGCNAFGLITDNKFILCVTYTEFVKVVKIKTP